MEPMLLVSYDKQTPEKSYMVVEQWAPEINPWQPKLL